MKRLDVMVKMVVEDKDFEKLQEIVNNKYAEGDDSLERLITEGLFENHVNCASVRVEKGKVFSDDYPDLTTTASDQGWGDEMEQWYACADRFLAKKQDEETECAPF